MWNCISIDKSWMHQFACMVWLLPGKLQKRQCSACIFWFHHFLTSFCNKLNEMLCFCHSPSECFPLFAFQWASFSHCLVSHHFHKQMPHCMMNVVSKTRTLPCGGQFFSQQAWHIHVTGDKTKQHFLIASLISAGAWLMVSKKKRAWHTLLVTSNSGAATPEVGCQVWNTEKFEEQCPRSSHPMIEWKFHFKCALSSFLQSQETGSIKLKPFTGINWNKLKEWIDLACKTKRDKDSVVLSSARERRKPMV